MKGHFNNDILVPVKQFAAALETFELERQSTIRRFRAF
jgi:hypothetical protein